MIRRRKTLNNLFYRLLIGCLLFSVLFMRIPSWARSDELGSIMDESSELTIVEGNPVSVTILITIISEVAKMVVIGWIDKRKAEELENRLRMEIKRVTDEDLQRISEGLQNLELSLDHEIASLKNVDIKQNEKITTLDELRIQDYKSLKWLIETPNTIIDQEIQSRRKEDAELAKDIANLRREVSEIIPETQVIIPKLEKVVQEAKTTIGYMKDKIKYIETIKKELKEETESRKAVDVERAKRIENLERLKEITNKEIETLKTINAWQTKAIKRDRTIIFFLTLGIIYAIAR